MQALERFTVELTKLSAPEIFVECYSVARK